MLVDAHPLMAPRPITTELPGCEADLLDGYPEHTIVVGSVRHVGLPAEPLDPLLYAADQLSSLSP